jgi:hypothetical protein
MSASRLNGPFPFGISSGSSTGCELVCQFCGQVYNEGHDVDKDGKEGESVLYIGFIGKTMAKCCFTKLEKGVFAWREHITEWLLKKAKSDLEKAAEDIAAANKAKEAIETLETLRNEAL